MIATQGCVRVLRSAYCQGEWGGGIKRMLDRIAPCFLASSLLLWPSVGHAQNNSASDIGVPDCDANARGGSTFCRATFSERAAAVEKRLAGRAQAWWRDGARFNVVARRQAHEVTLCCAIQAPLTRLPGTDLWGLSAEVPDLDRAILDVVIFDGVGQPSLGEWRGPKAGKAPAERPLDGRVETVELKSAGLEISRKISVYLPSGHKPGESYPVVYMADGEGVEAYAPALDAAIAAGQVPKIVVVGVWNAALRDQSARSKEQLIGFEDGAETFETFQRYFREDVVRFAEARFGASTRPKDRILAGSSNGAAWALSTAARAPDAFPNVISLANGWSPALRGAEPAWGRMRVFAEAGTLEPHASKLAAEIVDGVTAAGGAARLYRPVSGHTSAVWLEALPGAIKYCLAV